MQYTSEIHASILARDAQQRQPLESLISYEVFGTDIGSTYRDGTKAKRWDVIFHYPSHVSIFSHKGNWTHYNT